MSANKQGYTPKEIESLVRRCEPSLSEDEVAKYLKRVDSMGVTAFNAWLRGVHGMLKGER